MSGIVVTSATPNFGAKQSDPSRTFWLMPDCSKLDAIWTGEMVTFGEGIELKKLDGR